MARMIELIVAAAVFIWVAPSLSQAADAPLSPRVFSHPDRLRYDSQCFTIDGKDTFLFAGAFQYFRCPKELWSDRFDKIKAAGFNAVETVVPWNMHERAMPASVDDYSQIDLKDLEDWLTMAEARGLYVILRPGPYICAEWDCGGFPQWLLTKRPTGYRGLWLRSDEPSFIAWSNHWFHAVDQIAVKHQLTHRARGTFGIILYQLEDEYGHHQPYDVEVRYLHALGKQAMDDGIDVPLFTCWTEVVRGSTDPILRQMYDTCNLYPRFDVDSIAGKIAQLQRQQPDVPLQTTELQGGWFSRPGEAGSLSQSWTDVIDTVSPAQIQNLTLYAIEKGDRAMCYYMLVGGTNFGDLAPLGITTSYDYSAPIREIGSVGEKYSRVAAIGAMLKEHGERLARASAVACAYTIDQNDVTLAARKATDGSLYLFLRTRQHSAPRRGHFKIELLDKSAVNIESTYDLEPFGSKIFQYVSGRLPGDPHPGPYLVDCLQNRGLVTAKRPTDGLPTTVKLTRALTKPDAGPVQWQPLKGGQTLEQMGIYDRRFVFYRTHLDVEGGVAALGKLPTLSIDAPSRDYLLASVNGEIDPAINCPGAYLMTKSREGTNTIEILYENAGQRVGGAGMEQMAGMRKIDHLVTVGSIVNWRMANITPPKGQFQPERLKEVAEDFRDADWTELGIEPNSGGTRTAGNQIAVFRGRIGVTAEQVKVGDLFVQVAGRFDEAWVFVNGRKVGEGRQRDGTFTVPATGLHDGANTIAAVIRDQQGRGGLGVVNLLARDSKVPGLPIQIGTESAGFAEQWWNTDLDDARWKSQAVDQPAESAQGLQWSRLKFQLPPLKKGIWVPWVARLTTTGNGFLYVNGHPLGRYWQVGPQHDFFLPECWMNFGPGKTNVLATCLRSVDGRPVSITSAEIVPVDQVAEFRP
jgi:hypothetical protein